MLICIIFQNYCIQPLFTIFRGTAQSIFQYQKLYTMFAVVPLNIYYFRINYFSRYVEVMGYCLEYQKIFKIFMVVYYRQLIQHVNI
jgi:hypothetical protein